MVVSILSNRFIKSLCIVCVGESPPTSFAEVAEGVYTAILALKL